MAPPSPALDAFALRGRLTNEQITTVLTLCKQTQRPEVIDAADAMYAAIEEGAVTFEKDDDRRRVLAQLVDIKPPVTDPLAVDAWYQKVAGATNVGGFSIAGFSIPGSNVGVADQITDAKLKDITVGQKIELTRALLVAWVRPDTEEAILRILRSMNAPQMSVFILALGREGLDKLVMGINHNQYDQMNGEVFAKLDHLHPRAAGMALAWLLNTPLVMTKLDDWAKNNPKRFGEVSVFLYNCGRLTYKGNAI